MKKKYKSVMIASPVNGEVFDLSEVPDEVFSSGMMGGGAAVLPSDGLVTSPVEGTVAFVFDTKHAIGFVTNAGFHVMIHMGIDTVKLEGRGFEALVEQGQRVTCGQPVLKLDLDYLNAHAPSMMSPVLVTETAENQTIKVLKNGTVKRGRSDSFGRGTIDKRTKTIVGVF